MTSWIIIDSKTWCLELRLCRTGEGPCRLTITGTDGREVDNVRTRPAGDDGTLGAHLSYTDTIKPLIELGRWCSEEQHEVEGVYWIIIRSLATFCRHISLTIVQRSSRITVCVSSHIGITASFCHRLIPRQLQTTETSSRGTVASKPPVAD
jgi:hypothetical protein